MSEGECTNDEIVGIIGASSHLLLEHVNHGLECACTSNFSQHVVQFTFRHKFTNVVKSTTDIILGDGTVFVDIHEFEALLVHVELLLGEAPSILSSENIKYFLIIW